MLLKSCVLGGQTAGKVVFSKFFFKEKLHFGTDKNEKKYILWGQKAEKVVFWGDKAFFLRKERK